MNVIRKSNLTDKLKKNVFRAAVESVLVYGSIVWILTSLEKKLNGEYTRMLRAALNKSWRKMLTNEILYNGIPNISAKIKEHRMRFAGHCWRSKNELASDLLLWYQITEKNQEVGLKIPISISYQVIEDAKEKHWQMQCKIEMDGENES